MNPLLVAPALQGMAQQRDPAELLLALLATEAGSAQRLFRLIYVMGRGAALTGSDCIGWCGHTLREGFSVAGNMLAGPQVIQALSLIHISEPTRRTPISYAV